MNPAEKPVESAAPTKSKGEKLFEAGVYGLLNYVGTFIVTLAIAERLEGTRTGQTLCEWGKRGFMKLGMKEEVAKSAVTTSILMPGGSLMLGPLHWLERRRTPIVAKLNARYGDTTDQALIAQEVPEQTWGSLIKGRLVAWGVVFGSMVAAEKIAGPDNFKAFSNHTAEKFSAAVGVAKAQRNAESSILYRYGRLGALDVFATLASTALLYVSSKFFARKREEHQEYLQHHPEMARHRVLGLGDKAQADIGPEKLISSAQSEGKLATIAPELEAAAR